MNIKMNAERTALVALLSLGLGVEALQAAPPFERVHGATLNFEQAHKGAAPVQVCPGGGYISAGFTQHQGTRIDRDVYVVRTLEFGTLLWARSFDVNNALGDDVGTSIREIRFHPQAGFIVAGTTIVPGHADRDLILLRLDCDGNLIFCGTYQTLADQTAIPTDDEARDVIETATGAQAGDFVLAGSSRRTVAPGLLDLDAYLVRTTPGGAMRWSRIYSESVAAVNPHYSEWLIAVAEAQPVQGSGSSLGDILAVGGQEGAYGNWRDGLAVRASGVNGQLTAPLHTMTKNNLPMDGPLVRTTELWAIRELQPGSTGERDLAMVGTNAAYLGPSEGYAVRTGPNLNNVLAERLIGDGMAGPGEEGFLDVVEIANPSLYATPGQLAVTGFAQSAPGLDALLLALDAATLLPVSGSGRLYGDHGVGDEWGTALAQVLPDLPLGRDPGFYLNGINRGDPEAVGDPEDMYLIKTNAAGFTPCALSWSPFGSRPEDCPCVLVPQTLDPGTVRLPCASQAHPWDWGTPVCGW